MRALKLGDSGEDVRVLQTELNALGYNVIAVDGIFGSSTQIAVKAFQKAKGLVVDGVVGPVTDAALIAEIPVPSPGPTPPTQLQGIDVSDDQPHTDWGLVAKDGISFAFIKATEGYSYQNPYFATDWRAAKAAGVLRGAYHFYRPADDAVEQAKFMLNTVGPDVAGMIRPVLDWEVTDGVSASDQITGVLAFAAHVKSVIQVNPILYFSASWPDNYADFYVFNSFTKWVAEYGPRCRIPFDIWQYSESGQVDGVKTAVDRSLFNGTADQFQSRFVISV